MVIKLFLLLLLNAIIVLTRLLLLRLLLLIAFAIVCCVSPESVLAANWKEINDIYSESEAGVRKQNKTKIK